MLPCACKSLCVFPGGPICFLSLDSAGRRAHTSPFLTLIPKPCVFVRCSPDLNSADIYFKSTFWKQTFWANLLLPILTTTIPPKACQWQVAPDKTDAVCKSKQTGERCVFWQRSSLPLPISKSRAFLGYNFLYGVADMAYLDAAHSLAVIEMQVYWRFNRVSAKFSRLIDLTIQKYKSVYFQIVCNCCSFSRKPVFWF